MKAKTLEQVISDLKAQCDTKASAVAELLEDMRFNEEAKDFNLADCADEVADMGEWGAYAAKELRGTKPEKAEGLIDIVRGMNDHAAKKEKECAAIGNKQKTSPFLKLENWLVNKCVPTLWRNEDGLVLYEGEFITDTVLNTHEAYTVVSVQFYAPKGKGPACMRRAIKGGARTAYALRKDLSTFATFGKAS